MENWISVTELQISQPNSMIQPFIYRLTKPQTQKKSSVEYILHRTSVQYSTIQQQLRKSSVEKIKRKKS